MTINALGEDEWPKDRLEQTIDDVFAGEAIIKREIVVAPRFGISNLQKAWHCLDAVSTTGCKATTETIKL